MCKNLHVDEICENSSCLITSCNRRHPRECRYFREYNRCKFTLCKFNHITRTLRESEIGKLQKDHLDTFAKILEIEKILKEKSDVEIEIKRGNDRLETFEHQIVKMEQNLRKQEEDIKELLRKMSLRREIV